MLRALDLGGPRLYWLDGGAMFGAAPRPRWSSVYLPPEDNTIPLTEHVIRVQDGTTWGLLDSGFGHHLSDRQHRTRVARPSRRGGLGLAFSHEAYYLHGRPSWRRGTSG